MNSYFSDLEKDYVYKADIKVFKKSFSGIFIVKKLGDNNHRVVFTTEMGNKLFDFSILKDDFKVNFILEEMNKKVFINILQKDFQTLLRENVLVDNSYSSKDNEIYESTFNDLRHYYFYASSSLEKIVRVKKSKKKTEFLFSKINGDIAESVQINHFDVKLEIHLKWM